MKRRALSVALGLATGGVAFGQFTPIALDPTSFNQDVVVETSAQPGLVPVTSASIDGGTNNTGSTWYEVGYNPDNPESGLPAAGSVWTSVSAPDHSYRMAPNYVNANNGVLINTVITNATLTLTTPVAYSSLSFVGSGGNGGGRIDVVVHHADGSTENHSFNNPDWFGGASPAWIAYGRVNAQTFGFDTQASITDPGNPRLYARDIALNNTTSPVTKIDLKYGSGGANVHNGIFAVSGATSAGGSFDPIVVTGYNYDFLVEATAGRPTALNATTASMDGGVNNTGNSWYEQGYHTGFPETGLPPAGSTVTSPTAGDHTYSLPGDYSQNNAVFVDPGLPFATIALAESRSVSALSFLAAAGNGPSSIDLTITHEDGSSQAATISVPDWFGGANPVVTANGRVNVETGAFANVNSGNPRIYGIDVPVSNTTSPVTTIDLSYTSTGGRAAILAVSGTAGAIAPIFSQQPVSVRISLGEDASFTIVTSGTEPITYQWQRLVDGEFVNVIDGARFSGATTATLTITGGTPAEDGQYRAVAQNAAGPVNSSVATLTVLSPLPDVTAPGDSVQGFGGTSPGAEGPGNAIDDTTTKYLNFGANGGAPFVGPVGIIVTPAMGRTVVSGLRVYNANDASDRDPIDYRLEGSNNGGASYSVISEGPLTLTTERNAGGQGLDAVNQALQQVMFPNTAGYITYRLSFSNVRANSTSVGMQIAEVELLGTADASGAPGITAPTPSPAAAVEGTSVTFSVTATGTPAPNIRWQRLANGEYENLSDSANVSGSGTATLTLNNVALADATSFRAIASNASGSVTSAPTALTVFSSLPDVTSPFDVITGFGDTTVGAPNGPGATEPAFAIDDTFTKYLNGGSGFNAAAGFPPFAGPVGVEITPAAGATTVRGLRIYTAEGNTERDPVDYKLEGSNDGTTYTVIAQGALNPPAQRNAVDAEFNPVTAGVQEVLFSNTRSFASYRVTFTNVRNNDTANSLQIAELELLGTVGESNVPELTITRSANGTLTISSSVAGTLESTTSLSNNTQWVEEGPINGSVTVTPTAGVPMKFYRVRVP